MQVNPMTFFACDWGLVVIFLMGLPGWVMGLCFCLFISLMGLTRFIEAIQHLASGKQTFYDIPSFIGGLLVIEYILFVIVF